MGTHFQYSFIQSPLNVASPECGWGAENPSAMRGCPNSEKIISERETKKERLGRINFKEKRGLR
jgi:hypothetical protein